MGSESRQVQGVRSKVIEPGLVLASVSESGDEAFFASGGGLYGLLTCTVAEGEPGELHGCLVGAEMLLVGLGTASIAVMWVSAVEIIPGGSAPGPGGMA